MNESQVVQISDTCFLINARSHRFPDDSRYAPAGWSPWNFGKTSRCRGEVPVTISGTRANWGKTQRREDARPPCQGAIWRYSALKSREKSRLLFVPPSKLTAAVNNRTYEAIARINGTVRLCYDEGRTWACSKRIYGTRFTEFQHSEPGNPGGGQVGYIFEAWPQICLASFGVDWPGQRKIRCKSKNGQSDSLFFLYPIFSTASDRFGQLQYLSINQDAITLLLFF